MSHFDIFHFRALSSDGRHLRRPGEPPARADHFTGLEAPGVCCALSYRRRRSYGVGAGVLPPAAVAGLGLSLTLADFRPVMALCEKFGRRAPHRASFAARLRGVIVGIDREAFSNFRAAIFMLPPADVYAIGDLSPGFAGASWKFNALRGTCQRDEADRDLCAVPRPAIHFPGTYSNRRDATTNTDRPNLREGAGRLLANRTITLINRSLTRRLSGRTKSAVSDRADTGRTVRHFRRRRRGQLSPDELNT